MNHFETTDSIRTFIHSLNDNDKVVLYPLCATPQEVTRAPPYKIIESVLLKGGSPIFGEVTYINCEDDYEITEFDLTIEALPYHSRNPDIDTGIYISMEYTEETDEWSCVISTDEHRFKGYDFTFASITLPQNKIMLVRLDDFCESVTYGHMCHTQRAENRGVFTREILPDCIRHTERVMMRELFTKKLCDTSAADIIAREFYPVW